MTWLRALFSNRDLFCLATENRTQDTSHALSSQAQAKVRKISGLIVDLHDYLDIDLAFVSHSFFIHIPIDFSESQIISKLLYRLRVFEYHTNNNHKIRAIYHYTLLNRLVKKYSIHIHPNTCGKRLSIAYLGTIIINDEARIGDYLRIHVGVVIGKSHGGVPHIGNNVYIGPGAKVFGDISISDNCKIGANAVVCQS